MDRPTPKIVASTSVEKSKSKDSSDVQEKKDWNKFLTNSDTISNWAEELTTKRSVYGK